ncbi:MAG TPA: nuclear transport factor 2 family protein [Terriglobales bacterium]|nr:nuclear transport factor 2 family protein [Terriglobales bacterium]
MLRRLAIAICIVLLTFGAFGQSAKSSSAKTSKKSASGVPDKALLQKIWDGWGTLDPANTEQFYAKGEHTFFDIAPLKYNNWDEYKAGVTKVLADYKSAKFTVNDDAQLHRAGEYVWGTATVKSDMTTKADKREEGNFRWTMVFHREAGKWLIVHEHVSAPLQQ